MADDPTTGQVPGSSDQDPTGQAPAAPSSSTDATSATTPGQAPDDWEPERAKATIAKLRDTEKALSKQARDAAREAAELKGRLQALENEKLSEEERRQKAFDQAQERLAALEREQAGWQRERQELQTQHAVASAAVREVTNAKGEVIRAAFHNPDDAYRMLDLAALEYDDDGRPVNVEPLLAALAKAKPYLVKTTPAADPGFVAAGSPSNPPRGKATDAPPKTQAQKYADVFGSAIDIFDPQSAAQFGGGVRPPGE